MNSETPELFCTIYVKLKNCSFEYKSWDFVGGVYVKEEEMKIYDIEKTGSFYWKPQN